MAGLHRGTVPTSRELPPPYSFDREGSYAEAAEWRREQGCLFEQPWRCTTPSPVLAKLGPTSRTELVST